MIEISLREQVEEMSLKNESVRLCSKENVVKMSAKDEVAEMMVTDEVAGKVCRYEKCRYWTERKCRRQTYLATCYEPPIVIQTDIIALPLAQSDCEASRGGPHNIARFRLVPEL